MEFDDTQSAFSYKLSSPHSSVHSEGQSYPEFALPHQALVDWKDMPMFRLQIIINDNWLLQGKLAGEVIQLDPLNDKEENIQVLRVKVMLDSEKPLLMGSFLPIYNGRKVWVTCTLERAYRVCEQCGRLGHLDKDYNWMVHKTSIELQWSLSSIVEILVSQSTSKIETQEDSPVHQIQGAVGSLQKLDHVEFSRVVNQKKDDLKNQEGTQIQGYVVVELDFNHSRNQVLPQLNLPTRVKDILQDNFKGWSQFNSQEPSSLLSYHLMSDFMRQGEGLALMV
ncbi:uncharacterized protein G2W53_026158 [Senna tora]|uniref:Zinc knuckle CX2CX4HX4C domain-containing protein n=1 Tax=Senna tora TaxID=362788 RepID=A0A834TEP9_9FABA|nr:uncharacterized protein G2W53_026158 [Senna tora]